ncbi:hypothetical protein TNCV_4520561 [Trichonephila clavipes]|nr:hypothetical protein TNCV_4520561 [Trichonephila clavipes]
MCNFILAQSKRNHLCMGGNNGNLKGQSTASNFNTRYPLFRSKYQPLVVVMVEMIVVHKQLGQFNNHLNFTKERLTEKHYRVIQRAIISRQKGIFRRQTTPPKTIRTTSNGQLLPLGPDGNDLTGGKLEAWNTDDD